MNRPWLPFLWWGQLLSGVGDQLHQVAVVWIATQEVGGYAAWVVSVGAAFRLGFGLVAGVLADRWNRRRTMIVSDIARAFAVATLPVAAVLGEISLWHLAAVSAVLGALDSLFQPALQASLPVLAPQASRLQRANALLNVTSRLSLIIGPGITGLLLGLIPISQFFSLNAVTFVASALAIAAIGRRLAAHNDEAAPREPGRGMRGVLEDIRGAAKLTLSHDGLRWGLVALVLSNLTWTAAIVGLALFVDSSFERDAGSYGVLFAAYGVSNVLSNLAIAWRPIVRREWVMSLGGLIFNAGFIAVAFAPSFEWAIALMLLPAIGGPMTDVPILMMIQRDFPADQIGKVFSLRTTLSSGGLALGYAVVGPLFEILDVRTALTLACLPAVLACTAALWRFRS
ncbi:MAG: MFS transporter [bacterium]|nr:MFS transporter [bacterium]